MGQSDEEQSGGDTRPSRGALAKLRYYLNEIIVEAYHFTYGLFFASTKKDEEYEDERWRARKPRN